MIAVAAFTGGRDVPSARFRVRQYIEKLRSERVDVTEHAAPLGTYPPAARLVRPIWGVATLGTRVPAILASHRYDLTLLQRELLSTYFTLESFTKRPRVLDVDDAIWVLRGGTFAARLAAACDAVICGNGFLAEYFSRWNPRVSVVPTAVDTARYLPATPVDAPVIGWIGTSWSLRYLHAIEPALATVLKEVPEARIRVVCDAPPDFREIPVKRLEFVRWSPEDEVPAIQGMAIGIMPLEESDWARGKCSYKMLTYMACGLPVVVSPVGTNGEVLSAANIGFGARTADEWISMLSFLCKDRGEGVRLGAVGRQVVLERYSVASVVKLLARTLLTTAEK